MSALQTTRCVLLSYLHLFSLAAVCLHLPRECIIKTMWLHNQGLGMFKNSNTGSTDLNRIPTRYQMQRWRPLKTNENRLPTAYAKKKKKSFLASAFSSWVRRLLNMQSRVSTAGPDQRVLHRFSQLAPWTKHSQ